MLQVNHFGRGPTPWQNSFQPFASASRKRKRRGGREKKQNNQPLQISVKLMVKIVNRSCTSSDAAKQPRQRKSIHGSLPYETIKFNALSTIT
jgi:hypothetical protein